MVNYHWLKLIWVYCLNGLAQLTLTSALLMIPITLYKDGGADWTYALIAVERVTLFSWLMAIIFATATWLDMKKNFEREK